MFKRVVQQVFSDCSPSHCLTGGEFGRRISLLESRCKSEDILHLCTNPRAVPGGTGFPTIPLPTCTPHACNRAFQPFLHSFCPGRVRAFLGRMDFRMRSWFIVSGRPVRRRGSADRSCKQNYPDTDLGKQARPAILHAEDYACCIFQSKTGSIGDWDGRRFFHTDVTLRMSKACVLPQSEAVM